MWVKVLKLERVGIHDNFFDLGGHSLLGIKLMSLLREEFRTDLPLRWLLESPTIAGIAARIHAEHKDKLASHQKGLARWSYLFELKPGNSKAPVFFFPGGVGGDYEFLIYARLAHYVGADYPFYGLRARSADGTQPSPARVEEMVADYLEEIRSLQAEGPYFLIGNCIGGVLAYEMACQLQAQGQKVALLLLMDTERPTILRYLRYRAERMARPILAWGQSTYHGVSDSYYVRRIAFHWNQIRHLDRRDKLAYLFTRAGSAVLELPRILPQTRHSDRESDFAVPDQMQKVQESYIKTLRRYRPRPYSGRITLLINEKSYSQNPTMGWSNHLIAGGIEISIARGDHWTYIREHVQAVAKQLRECLEKAAVDA
jgi:thioesterase domain-containing protein